MRTNLSSQFTPDQRAAYKLRIVKRNTFQFERDGETVIRLHETDIVRKRNGYVILNSGGWKTVTTKDRMNDHLPAGYRLFSDHGQWYVAPWRGSWETLKRERVPFFDGMAIPNDVIKPKYKSVASE